MYRVEFFDIRKGSFRSACFISRQTEIPFDYLAPESFQITCPVISVEIMDAVRISKDSQKVFEGFVSAVEGTDKETLVSLAPFLMMIDVLSVQNVRYTNWSYQLYQQLIWDYTQPVPSLFPLPLQYSGGMDNWQGVQTVYGAELKSDMECIISAAEIYGKFMDFFLLDSLKIGYKFLLTPPEIVIEADLENIIDKQINVDFNAGYNMAMIWFPSGDGENYNHRHAYKLTDGSISYNLSDAAKITEPRMTSKQQDRDFASDTEAQNALLEMLKPASGDNEILLTVKADDRIIRPLELQIGQPARIISAGKEYAASLTGRNITGGSVQLVFGYVRNELTKKLKRSR